MLDKFLWFKNSFPWIMDIHDKKTRSYNMSRIRSKDTKPELIVRRFLFSKGFRFRLHVRSLPGHPDIVLRKYKTVIFVHGCFWHGHEHCSLFKMPKTRTEWWKQKIEGNRKRDFKNFEGLLQVGWKVLTIFECDLRPQNRDIKLNEIIAKIH